MNENKPAELYNMANIEPPIISKRIKHMCHFRRVPVSVMLHDLNISKNTLYYMDKGTAMSYTILVSICNYLNMPIDTLLRCNTAPTPTPAPEPVSLTAAIDTVAAAAHISPDALRAVLHLPINDK
jgi:DNA-binding Xre family transcriptional regulator